VALTRDDVVDAAVRLLAEVGLEGLTLRRLARDLGVSAPTLYWHVTDKRALLDHVADRLLADQWRAPGPEPDQPWWEWLGERAMGQYRALVAHRDAALVVAGNRPTEASMPAVEVALVTLIEAGMSPVDAFWTLLAVGNLVVGSAVEYHAELARSEAATEAPARPDPAPGSSMAALARDLAATDGHGRHEDVVRHGLDLMIAGLRAQVEGAQAGSPTDVAATSATWSR
jgi:TetR/AcrR family transcriptional regulator, tetracycline repressor protein